MLIVLDLYNCAQSFVAAVGHNYHQLHRDNIMPISHLVHIFNTVEYLLNIRISAFISWEPQFSFPSPSKQYYRHSQPTFQLHIRPVLQHCVLCPPKERFTST